MMNCVVLISGDNVFDYDEDRRYANFNRSKA